MTIALRVSFYRFFIKKIGKNVVINHDCKLLFMQGIEIGNNVFINFDTTIDGQGGVIIGDDVTIGPDCNIWSTNHIFSEAKRPINQQGHATKKVIIENDVWIGAAVILLPGVTVGRGSIIGAGSVVTKNIPEYSIAVGNPARTRKRRV